MSETTKTLTTFNVEDFQARVARLDAERRARGGPVLDAEPFKRACEAFDGKVDIREFMRELCHQHDLAEVRRKK